MDYLEDIKRLQEVKDLVLQLKAQFNLNKLIGLKINTYFKNIYISFNEIKGARKFKQRMGIPNIPYVLHVDLNFSEIEGTLEIQRQNGHYGYTLQSKELGYAYDRKVIFKGIEDITEETKRLYQLLKSGELVKQHRKYYLGKGLGFDDMYQHKSLRLYYTGSKT
jgi:hypothetical protein